MKEQTVEVKKVLPFGVKLMKPVKLGNFSSGGTGHSIKNTIGSDAETDPDPD